MNEIPEDELEARAKALLDSHARFVRRFLLIEGFVGLPTLVVGFAFDLPVLMSCCVVVAVVWFLLYRRRLATQGPRAVVLWVRRFHRGAQARREQGFLESAAGPWGHVITLSDSSIQEDTATEGMGTWIAILNLVLFAASLFVRVDSSAHPLDTTAQRRKKARVEMNEATFRSRLAGTVAKIRSGKFLGFGTVVFSCPREGELWREVIRDMATQADAVIIGGDERSAQVEWEIQTLSESLGPKQFLMLARGCEGPATPILPGASFLAIPEKIRLFPHGQQVRNASVLIGATVLRSRRLS